MRRNIFFIFFIFFMTFFTACSSEQAVKKYYRAYLTGDYLRASRHVLSGQRESLSLHAAQLQPEERRQLRRRKVRVQDVSTDFESDSTAVATCMVLLKEPDHREDTLYRLVLLKKEGRRWKVNHGIWSER